MSVEKKIRDFLEKSTVAEASYPGMGKNKESEAPMQGSSQKPTTQTLVKGAGADAAVKASAATTLSASNSNGEKKPAKQGDSQESVPHDDLGADEPGKVAASKMKKTSKVPTAHGAGQAPNYTAGVDTASVVNQPSSKGNVQKEDIEIDEEELEVISEDEFNALSEEEQAEYELVELDDLEEDVESLDELSKKTLASYITKAASSAAEVAHSQRGAEERTDNSKSTKEFNKNYDKSQKYADKRRKRLQNIETAARKLSRKTTKEEFELEEGNAVNKAMKNAYVKKVGQNAHPTADSGRGPTSTGRNAMRPQPHDNKDSMRAYNKSSSGYWKSKGIGTGAHKEEFELDVNALFGDSDLSEEFRSKAASMFEAVVTARVADLRSQIEEEAAQAAAELVESYVEEMIEQVDAYLNYVAEQWVESNAVAVESTLRADITEDFLAGLKNLFEEHYIDMPAEKVDVVESMQARIAELEESLNSQINASVEMNEELSALKRAAVIAEISEGLAQTEAEKFASLVEDVSFEDESIFAEKLTVIKENYFPKAPVTPTVDSIEEDASLNLTESSPTVMKYAQALGRYTFSK